MKKITPLKSIRLFCLECMGEAPGLVRECPAANCALHAYRMGRNPNRAGVGGVPPIRNLKTRTQDAIFRRVSNV